MKFEKIKEEIKELEEITKFWLKFEPMVTYQVFVLMCTGHKHYECPYCGKLFITPCLNIAEKGVADLHCPYCGAHLSTVYY